MAINPCRDQQPSAIKTGRKARFIFSFTFCLSSNWEARQLPLIFKGGQMEDKINIEDESDWNIRQVYLAEPNIEPTPIEPSGTPNPEEYPEISIKLVEAIISIAKDNPKLSASEILKRAKEIASKGYYPIPKPNDTSLAKLCDRNKGFKMTHQSNPEELETRGIDDDVCNRFKGLNPRVRQLLSDSSTELVQLSDGSVMESYGSYCRWH